MNTAIQEVLDDAVERLKNEFQPEQVWLFGSYAWGEPDKHSDLDLLVIVSESTERPIARAQRAHRCLSTLPMAKDVIVKTRAEFDRFKTVNSTLDAQIVRHGRLLYG